MDVNFRQFDETEFRAAEDGARKATFVASDGTRDSAGTILNPDGWDLTRYNKNGIIGYQHKVYGSWDGTDNPDNVIGKGKAYTRGGKLMVDVEFEPEGDNELADKVWKKLQFGTLKAVSVGFRPIGRGHWGEGAEAVNGDNPTYYYAGQELLEVSVVNIPANPNALKRSLDEAQEAELKELRGQAEPVQDPAEKSAEELAKEAEEAEQLRADQAARSLELALAVAGAAL